METTWNNKDLLKTSEDVLRIIMNYKEVQYIRLVHISSIEQRSASKNVCESWNSVHLGQTALVVVHATPLSFMLLYGPVKCRKATFGYVTPPIMVIVPIVNVADSICFAEKRPEMSMIALNSVLPPPATNVAKMHPAAANLWLQQSRLWWYVVSQVQLE